MYFCIANNKTILIRLHRHPYDLACFALTLTSVSRNAFVQRGKEDGKCLASLT